MRASNWLVVVLGAVLSIGLLTVLERLLAIVLLQPVLEIDLLNVLPRVLVSLSVFSAAVVLLVMQTLGRKASQSSMFGVISLLIFWHYLACLADSVIPSNKWIQFVCLSGGVLAVLSAKFSDEKGWELRGWARRLQDFFASCAEAFATPGITIFSLGFGLLVVRAWPSPDWAESLLIISWFLGAIGLPQLWRVRGKRISMVCK